MTIKWHVRWKWVWPFRWNPWVYKYKTIRYSTLLPIDYSFDKMEKDSYKMLMDGWEVDKAFGFNHLTDCYYHRFRKRKRDE
jgi:hypothetical protein